MTFKNVFPVGWDVLGYFCYKFCEATRDHFDYMLKKAFYEGGPQIEVKVLVRVLNSTKKFERMLEEYVVKFGTDEGESSISGTSADDVKLKYADTRSLRKEPANVVTFKRNIFVDSISEVFVPYLSSYVKFEEKEITDIILKFGSDDRLEGRLWASSINLFNHIKQAFSRCCSMNTADTLKQFASAVSGLITYYLNSILLSKITVFENLLLFN